MKFLCQIITIIFISSCSNTDKKEVNQVNQELTILEYFDINTSWHYINENLHSCFQDTINSDIEIRLYTHSTFLKPIRYLNLRYKKDNWKGIIGIKPKLKEDESFEKEIIPKNGWKNFEDSLIKIDIKSLTFRDVEKDSLECTMLDGHTLYLEIITPNEYRIHSYRTPKYLINSYKDSESLAKFEKLFNLINYNFENHFLEMDK